MLRKHINTVAQKFQKTEIPFYSWECITIQLRHRDVDLVIPNELHMKMLIQFLVYKLETINGQRGTASRFLVNDEVRVKLFDKICFKYTIMKIRNKISYEAFVKNRSLLEHFFITILKSYQNF